MEMFKQKYLELSIKRRIQIGVGGVVTGICFLVFIVIIFSVLILSNISYENTIGLIEKHEDQQIKLTNNYMDGLLQTANHKIKYNIQNLRNLIQYYNENIDFLKNLELKTSDFFLLVGTEYIGTNQLFVYKFLDINYSYDSSFIYLLNSIAASYPLVKRLFMNRIFSTNQDSLIKNIQYFSLKYKTLFFFNPSQNNFKNNYNLQQFNTFISTTLDNSYYIFNTQAKLYNYFPNENDVDTIFNKNPLFSTKFKSDKDCLLYDENFEKFDMLFNVESLNFKNTFTKIDYQNFKNISNLNDIISADIDQSLIDNYLMTKKQEFKNVIPLFSTLEGNIISIGNCKYILKFTSNYRINAPLKITENITQTSIADCFDENDYKQNLKNLLNNYDDKTKDSPFKSLAYRLPIAKNPFTKKEIEIKIYISKSPNLSTNLMLNSNLIFSVVYQTFIIKNLEYTKATIAKIYYEFSSVTILIILLNFVFWLFIFAYIIYKIIKISESISKPINDLIEHVCEMGQIENEDREDGHDNKGDNFNKNIKKLEEISYPYDKDINDLIQICKVLIKGGFDEQYDANKINRNRRIKEVRYAYNNICVIKFNNLIIKEDEILAKFNSNKLTIFNFKVPDDIFKSQKKESEEVLNNLISSNTSKKELSYIANKKDSYLINESNQHNPAHRELEFLENSNFLFKEFINTSIKTKVSKISDSFDNLERDIKDIIKENEKNLEKDFLYKICMEATGNGSYFELITI